jgi:S1-C subfamily serine protease
MMDEGHVAEPVIGAVALEHLTGPSRGQVTWLDTSAHDITLTPRQFIRLSEARTGEPPDDVIARLHRAGDTYEIEVPEGCKVWVNGVRVTEKILENLDMIEFGESGPLSRFCLYRNGERVRKTVVDILSDCFAYIRTSRQPPAKRVFHAFCAFFRRLTRETTTLFRSVVVIALVALAALSYHQYRLSTVLQQRIESGTTRLENFAAAIRRAGEQTLRPGDLDELRQDIGRRLAQSAERLAALEKRSRAGAQVIAQSIPSVVFLQGAYGLRERSSNRMLRHVVDESGHALLSPLGQPLLSLEGNGPVAEREFTGTGFSIGKKNTLLTNRHVARPWENDASAEALADQNLEPVMIKFIAFQPGVADALEVEVLRTSSLADLAILTPKDAGRVIPGLKLAEAAPAAGDEVIVMGYPTGLLAMLAQSGEAFIEELRRIKEFEFWSVAARLAKEGHIAPLASRGIVGHATGETVVYDAETTHGGSGGPVLDMTGAVIAVNTAILPSYGGSNLGIPVAKVRAFLTEAGL